jgi:hypothetical protein
MRATRDLTWRKRASPCLTPLREYSAKPPAQNSLKGAASGVSCSTAKYRNGPAVCQEAMEERIGRSRRPRKIGQTPSASLFWVVQNSVPPLTRPVHGPWVCSPIGDRLNGMVIRLDRQRDPASTSAALSRGYGSCACGVESGRLRGRSDLIFAIGAYEGCSNRFRTLVGLRGRRARAGCDACWLPERRRWITGRSNRADTVQPARRVNRSRHYRLWPESVPVDDFHRGARDVRQ